jgi:hypothetical protein
MLIDTTRFEGVETTFMTRRLLPEASWRSDSVRAEPPINAMAGLCDTLVIELGGFDRYKFVYIGFSDEKRKSLSY